MNLAMHMLFDGKLLLIKTNWSNQSIFPNRDEIVHIVHGKRPFNFARCAIVLLFELNENRLYESLLGAIRVSETNLLILVP